MSRRAHSAAAAGSGKARVGVTTLDADIGGGVPRGTFLLIFAADEHGYLIAYREHGSSDVYDDYWDDESLGELLTSSGFLEFDDEAAETIRREFFRM